MALIILISWSTALHYTYINAVNVLSNQPENNFDSFKANTEIPCKPNAFKANLAAILALYYQDLSRICHEMSRMCRRHNRDGCLSVTGFTNTILIFSNFKITFCTSL